MKWLDESPGPRECECDAPRYVIASDPEAVGVGGAYPALCVICGLTAELIACPDGLGEMTFNADHIVVPR